jgi:hypothetical protein
MSAFVPAKTRVRGDDSSAIAIRERDARFHLEFHYSVSRFVRWRSRLV